MNILGQSALTLGVVAFALGFSVLARNVRNTLFIAFALLCSVISGWALSFALGRIFTSGAPGVPLMGPMGPLGPPRSESVGDLFYRIHLLFNIWLAPVAVGFIHVMVRVRDGTSRRFLELGIFAAMALTLTLLFRYDVEPGWLGESFFWAIRFVPILVVFQILWLMWIDRRLRRGIKWLPKLPPKLPTVGLVRRNLIYVGGLLVLLTSVMDHVPLLGKVVPSFGNIGLAAYLFFVSQAITQQRLLNLSALFSRFLVLLAVAFTLTVFYAILVGWIENSPELFFLNSFIASFLVLMLLDPIRSLVRYLTQRLLTQEHRRLETTLRDAQRALAAVLDAGTLFQQILLFVEQVLRPQAAALYVLRSDGTKLRRVRWVGQEPPSELREVLANHPLLLASLELRRRGELPVLLDQILESEIDRSASRAQRERGAALIQALRALGANMVIPLFDDQKILGVITISVPAPPEPWGANWGLLPIIYPYFEQSAKTLQSMEIYQRQREKERLATLGQLSAGLAHEIRNPLGAIKGAAQFLETSGDSNDARPESRFLRIIVEEVNRLDRVVTQFLDYSKPSTAELQPVEVGKLVGKSIELIRAGIPEGVRVEFIQIGPDCRIEASAEQIHQVLLNLIQNALRALMSVERSDRIIRVLVESSDREVLISVEDNGPGVKREHLDKLFIPFFTTSPSGTGLGLSISQKIIEAHRGRLEVASEEGLFCRFSMILPRL